MATTQTFFLSVIQPRSRHAWREPAISTGCFQAPPGIMDRIVLGDRFMVLVTLPNICFWRLRVGTFLLDVYWKI